jgi:hypothetical protein
MTATRGMSAGVGTFGIRARRRDQSHHQHRPDPRDCFQPDFSNNCIPTLTAVSPAIIDQKKAGQTRLFLNVSSAWFWNIFRLPATRI